MHKTLSLIAQPVPAFADERLRMEVVRSFDAQALQDDQELQQIVDFAAALCGTPLAFVNLIDGDRQLYLARSGTPDRESPRDVSFCATTMTLTGILEIADARLDPRFCDNPLVRDLQIGFYAGQPLVSEEGAPLGALCVADAVPRETGLTAVQRKGLEVLGTAVMRRLNSQRDAVAARNRLLDSEQRFRALTESMPDIAFSATGDGHFEYFNRRFGEFTGLGEWSGEARPEIIHPDDREAVTTKWNAACETATMYESVNRLRRADGTWCWMLVRAVPVMAPDGIPARWYGTMTDIDASYRKSENRELLAQELSHRIKNIFAVLCGLVSLSIRRHPENRAFGEDLVATIRALGRAHDYVRPSGGQRRDSLLGMLADIFSPYAGGAESRVRITGDDVAVTANAATPLALVFHELATNSAKYGALSTEQGHVDLSIRDAGDRLHMTWAESGGPTVQVRENDGFGSRLVDMSITDQLGGSWEREFATDGLICRIELPKRTLARSPR